MKDKNSSRKVTQIVLVIIILIAILLMGYGIILKADLININSQQEESNNHKISEGLTKDLEIKGVKVINISINKINDYYSITFDMVNETDEIKSIWAIKFVFIGENEKILGELERDFQPIAANETVSYEIKTKDEKLFKASKIRLEEVEFTE